MPNINTATITLTGTTTKRSLGDRLNDIVSVKDFGAVGDGSANDTAAIQACFDYCYGPFASPHGISGSAVYTNKAIYFPAGNYKISGTYLKLGLTWGATLLGAGSDSTRIFWSGSEVVDNTAMGSAGGYSPLMGFYTCWHTYMEGLTLDAGGVQNCVIRLGQYSASSPGKDNGHDGYYRDVVFTNTGGHPSVGAGFISTTDTNVLGDPNGGAMGSERHFVKCKFMGHKWGVRLVSGNALNYNFISCYFANNEQAFNATTGGRTFFDCCRFENNSDVDIATKTNMMHVRGCWSKSTNFITGDGNIVGCLHDSGATVGYFWNMMRADSVDYGMVMCTGNRSTNGRIGVVAYGPVPFLVLMGNTFDNSGYRAPFDSTGVRGGGVAPGWRGGWEDGVMIP